MKRFKKLLLIHLKQQNIIFDNPQIWIDDNYITVVEKQTALRIKVDELNSIINGY